MYKKDCGIYQILNLSNQKCYIGSSESMRRRLYTHRNLLEKNKHTNQHLQNAWNKAGGHNFIFRTLEVVDFTTQKNLEERENYWINYYDSTNPTKGYNKQNAERGTFTEEWKLKRKEIKSKQQTKEYFLKSKSLEDLQETTKNLIIDNLLKYTINKKAVSLKRTQHTLKITISNPVEYFYKEVFILLKPLKIITEEEYKQLLPEDQKIYQIEQGTNNIIKIYNNPQEILNEYPQTKRKQLERLLYSNHETLNYSSVSNMIFTLESNYDSTKIYYTRQRKDKAIKQIDKDGNTIKEYACVNHVIRENPTLNIDNLRQVLAKKIPTTGYPYQYINDPIIKLNESTSKSESVILELNEQGQPIKEFVGLKSILKEYPEITLKGLQKVLYEGRKSTKGHYFILKRNFASSTI